MDPDLTDEVGWGAGRVRYIIALINTITVPVLCYSFTTTEIMQEREQSKGVRM